MISRIKQSTESDPTENAVRYALTSRVQGLENQDSVHAMIEHVLSVDWCREFHIR